MAKIVEIKFYGINNSCYEVYKTKKGTPIVLLPDDNCFYTIASFDGENGIDGDPDVKLKTECLKIVDEFSEQE